MGRPIKKKFFANLISPYQNHAVGGRTGAGGEGVSSVTLSTSSLAVSTLTVTVSFSAPQIAGGVTATGTPVKTGNTVTSVTITEAGSGYTSAPTVTFTGTNMTTQGSATAVLTSNRQDGIAFISYLPSGTAAKLDGDILKQESSKRYLVQNSEGQGQCKLVTSSPLVAGQMHIIATDHNGSTYLVKKLTARRAVVVQSTASGSFLVADGASTGWTLDSATGTVVTISNTI